MGGIDYVILVAILLSTAVGVWRGFVRESLSLLVWIAAFWLAYTLTSSLEIYLAGLISDKALRLMTAFVMLFLLVHILGYIISRLLMMMVKSVGLKGVDRVSGGVFGLVRGLVIIAATVLLIGFTPVKDEYYWQHSYLVSLFEDGLSWVQKRYPLDGLASSFFSAKDNWF